MLDASQNVLCFAQKDPAGIGQGDVAPAAIEQRDAHRQFELPDLLAERRLRPCAGVPRHV
jgi:hypothetical protein